MLIVNFVKVLNPLFTLSDFLLVTVIAFPAGFLVGSKSVRCRRGCSDGLCLRCANPWRIWAKLCFSPEYVVKSVERNRVQYNFITWTFPNIHFRTNYLPYLAQFLSIRQMRVILVTAGRDETLQVAWQTQSSVAFFALVLQTRKTHLFLWIKVFFCVTDP